MPATSGAGNVTGVGLYTVLAVEPAALTRRPADRRIRDASVPVHHVSLEGQHIPLDAASSGALFITFTLCTVPDLAQALAAA